MDRTLLHAIAFSALPVLASCQADTAADTSAVEAIATESHCGPVQAGLEILTSATAVDDAPSSVVRAGLEVVESGDSMLVVYLGQRPTSGYGAELEGARRDGGRLRLDLNATEPHENAMTAQVITTPCVALRIPSGDWSEIAVTMDAEGFPLELDRVDRR